MFSLPKAGVSQLNEIADGEDDDDGKEPGAATMWPLSDQCSQAA